eukprot:8934573-Ditylum_brightwellii.AAC.1
MPSQFSAKGSVANVNAYAERLWVLLAVSMTDLVRVSTLSTKAEFHWCIDLYVLLSTKCSTSAAMWKG